MAAVAEERYVRLAVALLLLTQAGMLGYSATRHTPTHLEPAFLASGISHWQFERFELYRVNPPLVRMVAALPVLAVGCETDWTHFYEGPGARSEFPIGEAFVKANGVNSIRLFWYARWACIPFSLIGAYFAWRWSTALYGCAAGLLTLTLFVFEPNLLAHGELITPDAACTAFGILAGYAFWRWLRQPGWTRALLAGGALGLAQLSKMSWLILFGLWPMMWLCWRWTGGRPVPGSGTGESEPSANEPGNPGREGKESPVPGFSQLAATLVIAVYLMNLGYAFDGTGTLLKDFPFVSQALTGLEKPGTPGNRFRDTWAGEVPIPLPKQYVLGFDSQKKDFEDFGYRSYLRGVWQDDGWWYYYLYGLLVKVPCGMWGLLGLVVVSKGLRRDRSAALRDELVLLAPAVGLLVLVSSQTEFSIHLRYVFPSLGLGLIFLGQAANIGRARWSVRRLSVMAMTAWSVVSLLRVYPDHLAYFNEFVGGPENGRWHVMGSSLDWEQGTEEVVDWIVASGWSGPVQWSTRSGTLATLLLEQRRGHVAASGSASQTGIDQTGTANTAANTAAGTLRVYHADNFYDTKDPPTYERVLHRFRFGTVVVLEKP